MIATYAQNLTANASKIYAGRNIAIIIIRAKSKRLKDLLPHVRACLACIESIQPCQIVRIGD